MVVIQASFSPGVSAPRPAGAQHSEARAQSDVGAAGWPGREKGEKQANWGGFRPPPSEIGKLAAVKLSADGSATALPPPRRLSTASCGRGGPFCPAQEPAESVFLFRPKVASPRAYRFQVGWSSQPPAPRDTGYARIRAHTVWLCWARARPCRQRGNGTWPRPFRRPPRARPPVCLPVVCVCLSVPSAWPWRGAGVRHAN